MDIQALHMQNNAYRDMIKRLKNEINELDKKIQINEMEIGSQLGDMDAARNLGDCEMCLGDCNA